MSIVAYWCFQGGSGGWHALGKGFKLIPPGNTTNHRFTASDFGGNRSLFHSAFGKSQVFCYLDVCEMPIWSDARAAWNFQIHEQGESTRLKIYFLCNGYLIPCKPYPKRLLLSMLPLMLVLGRAALAFSHWFCMALETSLNLLSFVSPICSPAYHKWLNWDSFGPWEWEFRFVRCQDNYFFHFLG